MKKQVFEVDMSKELFKIGQPVCTSRINETIGMFAASALISRHVCGDFGDLCEEDKQMNLEAIKNGDDRILSSYNTDFGKIYVITEHDRSATTVLYADEY